MGIDEHDTEGRVITAEFPDYQLVTVYTPNAQDGLRRIEYRMQWDDAFRAYLLHLEEQGKPVVFCGDLNVVHEEIDLAGRVAIGVLLQQADIGFGCVELGRDFFRRLAGVERG